MAKLLVANGCSLTLGTELADPEHESWPAVLAGNLGLPVVNLACCGGSNRRIVRTTVANLERVCHEAGVGVEDALVICQWTGIDRTEYFRPRKGDRDPGNAIDKRPDLPYEPEWFRVGAWRTEQDKGTEAYYRHLCDDTGATVNWLVDWLALDGFLRARGATARYVYGWHLFQIFKTDLGGEIRDLMDLLDPTTIYGDEVYSKGNSFNDANVGGGYAFGQNGHPLAEAHANFAGLLATWLTTSGTLASA
jgi:hypothetical protein